MNPASSLREYDPTVHLRPELQNTFQDDESLIEQMLANLDPLIAESQSLSNEEIGYLIAFLESLTDPAVSELDAVIPENVPSGLAIVD